VVSREELLDAVWRNVHVTDDSITPRIAEIRRALGPAPRVVVRTVPRHGYMLETDGAPGQPAATAPLSIAVSSFAELGDIAPRSLGFAMSEDIAILLAKKDGVRVLMPDSDGTEVAGRTTDRVLSGTVRRAGGVLRVTARLIERGAGALLWAECYDRALPGGEDPIALDHIVAEIVAAVVRKAEYGPSGAA
jgi:TolB-like protein